MFANQKIYLCRLVSTFLLLVSAPLVLSQNSKSGTPPGQLTPEVVAASLWKTISVVCPVPGGSPATFIAFPNNQTHFYPLAGLLIEYRGAWTKFATTPLTEADRLNGIQFQGLAMMGATAERSAKPWMPKSSRIWSEWTDTSHETMPRTLVEQSQWDFLKSTIVVVEKRANGWSYKLLNRGETFDPDSFTSDKHSCADLSGGSTEHE